MRTLVNQSFTSSESGLACDSVSIESIVERVGTPVYLYSARTIRDSYRAIDVAFAPYPHRIHYALKANSTLAIVRLLRSIGSKVDANSGGEIAVAERAGFAPADIVFTGVGKTRDELERAIAAGIGTINAESAGELDRIAEIARAQGRDARAALRVNPDIDAGSHPNISTGLKINKFGVPLGDARAIYRDRSSAPGLRLVGVHVHIGSQITTPDPLRRAARTLADLAIELRSDGIALEHMDVGGGLGIAYEGRTDRRAEGLRGRRDSRAPARWSAGIARAGSRCCWPCRRAYRAGGRYQAFWGGAAVCGAGCRHG
jgi:diaminopimelate decarboxylase